MSTSTCLIDGMCCVHNDCGHEHYSEHLPLLLFLLSWHSCYDYYDDGDDDDDDDDDGDDDEKARVFAVSVSFC